MVRKWPGGG